MALHSIRIFVARCPFFIRYCQSVFQCSVIHATSLSQASCKFHDHRLYPRYSSLFHLFSGYEQLWLSTTSGLFCSMWVFILYRRCFFHCFVIHSTNLVKLGYLQVSGLPVLTQISFYVPTFFGIWTNSIQSFFHSLLSIFFSSSKILASSMITNFDPTNAIQKEKNTNLLKWGDIELAINT